MGVETINLFDYGWQDHTYSMRVASGSQPEKRQTSRLINTP